MDKFTKSALKEVKNLDEVLSTVTDNNLREQGKKYISKNYHNLFNAIDTELKANDELNSLINEAVKMRKCLIYDVKDSFTHPESFYYGGEDVTTGYSFNEEEYNFAKSHVETWSDEKQKLQAKIEKINGSSFLKFISGGRVKRLEGQIKLGDARYQRYKKIFDKEAEMKQIDKPALEKELKAKNVKINEIINLVIEKHILDAIKNDPSIVAYDVFIGDSNPFISTSSGSTEHNKNIYKYFDSREITKKLTQILKEYNKSKSLNVFAGKENQDGVEMGE